MGPFPVRLPTWAAMKKYQGPPDRRARPDRAMVFLMGALEVFHLAYKL